MRPDEGTDSAGKQPANDKAEPTANFAEMARCIKLNTKKVEHGLLGFNGL